MKQNMKRREETQKVNFTRKELSLWKFRIWTRVVVAHAYVLTGTQLITHLEWTYHTQASDCTYIYMYTCFTYFVFAGASFWLSVSAASRQWAPASACCLHDL